MALLKLEINVYDRDGFISAHVEDFEGVQLGEQHAPLVEGANFDARGAVIRAAVEEAIATLAKR